MSNGKHTINSLILLLFLSTLVGCDNTAEEEENAAAKAEEAQARSVEVGDWEKTQSEKGHLEIEVAKISKQLETAKTETAAILQYYEESKAQMDSLVSERDAAVVEAMDAKAVAKELADQLKEKTEEISGYEELVKELVNTVIDLENALAEMAEQPTEQTDEEVADGNSV